MALASLAFTLLLGAVKGQLGPSTTLLITNQNIAPDGFVRSAILAGGSFPGPLITAQPSSQFQITVQNQLYDTSMLTATSVHWHGMFQKNTQWADGVALVSQCPIVPGEQFTYSFNANGQAGTFWYHSHYKTQYCDGLRGPLVIYDPNDPHHSMYDIDNSGTVITLADWYHKPSPAIFPFAYPDSTLINGLGRAWNGTMNSALSVIQVAQNVRYRLRIVSISCAPAFTFSIDSHTLNIIEVDGQNHQPLSVDSLTIYAGQRYSAVLTASQPISNYWIRALPLEDGLVFNGDPFSGGANSAILRYNGAPSSDPTSRNTAGSNPLVESRLIPYSNPAAPGSATLNSAPDVYAVNLAFMLNDHYMYTLNGVEPAVPSVPVLLQIMSGAQSAQGLMPSNAGGQYISLPANTVVQLSFPAAGTYPDTRSPIHLHGHVFSVVRSAGQTVPNFSNPPRRDVVNAGASGDNVTIRFQTNNNGPWFLYSHVAWHFTAGFFAVLVEDSPPNIRAGASPPSSWNSLCSVWSATPTQTPTSGCTITASSQVYPTNCMAPGCVWAGPEWQDSPDTCDEPRPTTTVSFPAQTTGGGCTITTSSQVFPTSCLQPGCVWAGPSWQDSPDHC